MAGAAAGTPPHRHLVCVPSRPAAAVNPALSPPYRRRKVREDAEEEQEASPWCAQPGVQRWSATVPASTASVHSGARSDRFRQPGFDFSGGHAAGMHPSPLLTAAVDPAVIAAMPGMFDLPMWPCGSNALPSASVGTESDDTNVDSDDDDDDDDVHERLALLAYPQPGKLLKRRSCIDIAPGTTMFDRPAPRPKLLQRVLDADSPDEFLAMCVQGCVFASLPFTSSRCCVRVPCTC